MTYITYLILKYSTKRRTIETKRIVLRKYSYMYPPVHFKVLLTKTIFSKLILWRLIIKTTFSKRAKIKTAFNVYYVINFRWWRYRIGNPQGGDPKIKIILCKIGSIKKGKIDGFIIKTDQFLSTLKILPKHLYFRSKFW